MIEAHAAKYLLLDWAKYQRKELARLDYPAVSPMFKDYQGGYRSSGTVDDKADEAAEKVGQALARIHPGLRNTLKFVYLDRGGNARGSFTRLRWLPSARSMTSNRSLFSLLSSLFSLVSIP